MTRNITDEEFDRLFDAGESVAEFVDWDHPVHVPPIPEPEPITLQFSVTLPELMRIDEAARELGLTRSEYIRASSLGRRETAVA